MMQLIFLKKNIVSVLLVILGIRMSLEGIKVIWVSLSFIPSSPVPSTPGAINNSAVISSTETYY